MLVLKGLLCFSLLSCHVFFLYVTDGSREVYVKKVTPFVVL